MFKNMNVPGRGSWRQSDPQADSEAKFASSPHIVDDSSPRHIVTRRPPAEPEEPINASQRSTQLDERHVKRDMGTSMERGSYAWEHAAGGGRSRDRLWTMTVDSRS